jgi:hypothetical protein
VQRVRAGGDLVIKALTTMDANGRRTLILGLDDRNVQRLTTNQPLIVQGEEMGLDIDIYIAHAPSYGELFAQMRAAGFTIPSFPLDKPITLYGDELKGLKNS